MREQYREELSGLVMVSFENNLQVRILKLQDGLIGALRLDMRLMQMFFCFLVDGKAFRYRYWNLCI